MSISAGVLRKCCSTAWPRPRDCVTASLHDSAPGQLVTSAIESASGKPRPAACSDRKSAATSPRRTHLNTRFCTAVTRTVPSPYAHARSASTRNCAPLRSPSGTVTVAATNSCCFCATTFVRCHFTNAASSSSGTCSPRRHDAGTAQRRVVNPAGDLVNRWRGQALPVGRGFGLGRLRLECQRAARLRREPPRARRRMPRETLPIPST